MATPTRAGWLLLIHQIPPQPAYLRVKIGRRLQALGAVAVKNSVYVLPEGEARMEDLQWVRQEIVAGKGEAWVCQASFVEGLSDSALEALFKRARAADYKELERDARRLKRGLDRVQRLTPARAAQTAKGLARVRRRLAEIAQIDFFGAEGVETVEGILTSVEKRLGAEDRDERAEERSPAPEVRAATWVTRAGVHVDRIASAWLIRTFIDPDARFKLVAGREYAPKKGELRFDMFEGEFTHEGDLCTFEVLLRRFAIDDPALGHIGEIVHDIDLKESRYAHPEAAGVERLIAGIAMVHGGDDERLRVGGEVFAALHRALEKAP